MSFTEFNLTASSPGPHGPRRLLVKDVPIGKSGDDVLGHRDVATLLKRVLADWMDEPAPLHVALYGPWGAGKSGVISLLRSEVASETQLREAVKVLDFSLWRFGTDNVRRGLLLFLDGNDGLGTKSGIASRLSETSARTEASTRVNYGRLIAWMGLAVALLGAAVTLAIIGSQTSTGTRVVVQLLHAAAVAAALWGVLQQVAAATFTTHITEGSSLPPPDRADQFKSEFETLIGKARAAKDKWASPQKLVLVFDDLDRVPPDLAWEVLTTIKTFLDAPHCVYVIPCDREAVLEAMRESKGSTMEARAIDFLDKFFQVSFYLPEPFPREIKAIADSVREELDLPQEIGAIAIAGFSRTPRALKVFLNQVSLLSEFIKIRAQRLGDFADKDFLAKVGKVHAIRVLWPHCGTAIGNMPALMGILERRVQGLTSEERTAVSEAATQLLAPGSATFCLGLKEFLLSTMGIVADKQAQGAVKLSEAIWAEGRGDLRSLSIYFATGDSDGVRRLFASIPPSEAAGIAADDFNAETQTASPDALVGWVGVLLTAFFAPGVEEPAADIVNLAINWLTSIQVKDRLSRLPPDYVVRAVAQAGPGYQADTVGEQVITIAMASSSTTGEYTDAALKALSHNRVRLEQAHARVGVKLRGALVDLISKERARVIAILNTLANQVNGNEWELWWDSSVGSLLLNSVTGADVTDPDVLKLAGRLGYSPSAQERQMAVDVASRILGGHNGSAPDGYTATAVELLEKIALNGESSEFFSKKDVEQLASLLQRLSDPEEKLKHLQLGIRLMGLAGIEEERLFLNTCYVIALPNFARPQLDRLLSASLSSPMKSREWAAALLYRAVELKDPELFIQFAEKARDLQMVASALDVAYKTDTQFADAVSPRVQALCEPVRFAAIVENRIAKAGADAASTVQITTLLQNLTTRPAFSDASWHVVTMRLEQGTQDVNDPTSATSLRTGVRRDLLEWLPETEKSHLSTFASAVISGAVAGAGDPAEKVRAQIETVLMLSPICSAAHNRNIANGIAHVLARTSLPSTVLGAAVGAITATEQPALVPLIDDENWDALGVAIQSRTDEGRGFLESLLTKRPARSPQPPRATRRGR